MNIKWNYRLLKEKQDSRSPTCEVSTDPWFYQLEDFHNKNLILSHVTEPLRNRGFFNQCYILNVRYIPHEKFQVIYRLSNEKNIAKDTILLVRFFPRGESKKRYSKAIAVAVEKDSVLHLPRLDAVAWVFPEDPKLLPLSRMIDKQKIGQGLSKYLGFPINPDLISWDLLSYLPGDRCSVIYRIPPTDHILIGKMQNGISALESHCNILRLWEAPERQFRMPRPIGKDENLGIRWESFVPGKRIEDILSTISLDFLIKEVAHNLVVLHRMPMGHLMPNRFEKQVSGQLGRKALQRIRKTFASLGPEIDAFYKTLIQKAVLLPESLCVAIHGDFHPANVLIDPEGLVILDMDSLAKGHPAYDLAYFGSRLLLIALLRGERLSEVVDAVAHFPDAYGMAGGKMIPQKTFAWYMAAFLFFREIKSCILHRAPALGSLGQKLLYYASETLTQERFEPSIVSN